ncbi:uncharacterized protein DUF3179 [Nitrosomonas aestuarii]|nr:DUF3179 domain-containing (seleno)protein [Nitrosomonas aestuarii]PTN12272.1 uncharacterized protein DUF3179 [Nitrosomonas aestuarii]
MFPVRFRSKGYRPKEQVLGLILDGQTKAYPFLELAKESGKINDMSGKHPIQIRYDHNHKSAEIFDADGTVARLRFILVCVVCLSTTDRDLPDSII